MLIIISPAKKLDYNTPANTQLFSNPTLTKEAKILVEELKKCSIENLTKLMNISYGLAETNIERFANWSASSDKNNAKQAILAFNGDVYSEINAKSFSDKEFNVAQNKLRIISGLYGLLKPLDFIQPHRLSMGTKLSNNRGKNLYEFWGDIITNELNKSLKETGNDTLINLASNEYFKALNKTNINANIIDIVFKENKNGVYRVVSFYAKKARGLMSNFIIKNNINKIDDLKKFDLNNYYFDEKQSTKSKLVFIRESIKS